MSNILPSVVFWLSCWHFTVKEPTNHLISSNILISISFGFDVLILITWFGLCHPIKQFKKGDPLKLKQTTIRQNFWLILLVFQNFVMTWSRISCNINLLDSYFWILVRSRLKQFEESIIKQLIFGLFRKCSVLSILVSKIWQKYSCNSMKL